MVKTRVHFLNAGKRNQKHFVELHSHKLNLVRLYFFFFFWKVTKMHEIAYHNGTILILCLDILINK